MIQSVIKFKVNTPDVIFEIYDNEIVLINLDNGNYYSITDTASEIFDFINHERSRDEIIKLIIDKYEGEIAEIVSSIDSFLEDLLKDDLIIQEEKLNVNVSFQDEKTSTWNGEQGKSLFKSPVLNRYTDMQDLLLLDPIHEVDETGWPNTKRPVTKPDLDIKERSTLTDKLDQPKNERKSGFFRIFRFSL
jgi:hypothetical protein